MFIFSTTNNRVRSGSKQLIEPIPLMTTRYLIQQLDFQETGHSRYIGKYLERKTEIFVDSDEFFTIQMFFINPNNYIFQVQKKLDTALSDKAVLFAYNSKDIFVDRLSGKKFAIYTRPDSLRTKIFFADSPIWEGLRRLPSLDCSMEVGFSVKGSNSLIYQHSYVHEVNAEMMAKLLKMMNECCEVLEQI
jgi:hypothetical protein